MKVELLHAAPLELLVKAARKCWASEARSDSSFVYGSDLGPKDKQLLLMLIEKGHTSVLEHVNFTFDIDGISRAILQELARHRHASLSVKSTRYTLKELKDVKCVGHSNCDICKLSEFLVSSGVVHLDEYNRDRLCLIQDIMGTIDEPTNDQLKYMLPEAYKTSLIWTVNIRSLRNFLSLRSAKGAHFEIRKLAGEIYRELPLEYQFLVDDVLLEGVPV